MSTQEMKSLYEEVLRDEGGSEGTEANAGSGFARLRFGDWLVRRNLITREALFSALSFAFEQSKRVGDALVEMDILPRQAIEEEARRFHSFNAFQVVA